MATLPIMGKIPFAALLKNSLLVCISLESFIIANSCVLESGHPMNLFGYMDVHNSVLLRIGCSSTFACIIAVTATIISTIATARLFTASIATM